MLTCAFAASAALSSSLVVSGCVLWTGAAAQSKEYDGDRVLWNDGTCGSSGSSGSSIFSCFAPAADLLQLTPSWVDGGGRSLSQPPFASPLAQFSHVGLRTVGLMVHATGVVFYEGDSAVTLGSHRVASVYALSSSAGVGAMPTLALPAASSHTDRVVVLYISSSNISSSSSSSVLQLHVQSPSLCSSPLPPSTISWISLDAIFFPRSSPPLPPLPTATTPASAFDCTPAPNVQQVTIHRIADSFD